MRGGVRMLGTAARPIATGVRRLSARPRPHRSSAGTGSTGESDGLSTGVDDFRRHLDTLDAWGATVLPLDAAVAALEAGHPAGPGGGADLRRRLRQRRRDRLADPARARPAGHALRRLRLPDRRPPLRLGRARARARPAPPRASRRAARRGRDDGLDIGSHTVSHPWLPRLDRRRPSSASSSTRGSRSRSCSVGRCARWPTRPAAGRPPYAPRPPTPATASRSPSTAASTPRRTPHLSLRRAFVPTEPEDLRLLLDGAYTMLRPLDTWRRRGGPAW